MKKILIVINNLTGGGAEKVLVKLLQKLDSNKYQIDIFLMQKEGIYLQEIEEKYNVMYLNKAINREEFIILRKIKSLFRIIKRYIFLNNIMYIQNKILPKQYDIEIAFLEGLATEIVACKKSNSVKLAWVHTDLQKYRTMSKKKENEIYKKFDKIICVSKGAYQSLVKLYPNHKDKTIIIYNPIDKKEIIEKSKENIEFDSYNQLKIISVGRLVKAKGYDILLQAHNNLIKKGLKYKLIIIGEGEEYNNLRQYINKYKLEDYTELLGFKNNPYPYIKQSDIFVISSRYEGYSLVLAEAMILGKPIISTKTKGPIEIIENEYGVMIRDSDVNELEIALEKMIKDKEMRSKFSKKSIIRSEIFNIDEVIKKVENLLDVVN